MLWAFVCFISCIYSVTKICTKSFVKSVKDICSKQDSLMYIFGYELISVLDVCIRVRKGVLDICTRSCIVSWAFVLNDVVPILFLHIVPGTCILDGVDAIYDLSRRYVLWGRGLFVTFVHRYSLYYCFPFEIKCQIHLGTFILNS